ncbi:MAG TPA: hypothetical protein VIR65_14760 [Rhizorhapis sp.]
MGSTTAAGTALALCADTPATEDAVGYAALTFIEVGQVEKIGAIGATFAKVEFQPLKGPKQKHKGSADYGSLQPSLAHDDEDAGQTLLRTASDDATSKLYSVEVTYPDGAKRYFGGRVFGYPENTDSADSVIMANPTIEISTKIVKVAAT